MLFAVYQNEYKTMFHIPCLNISTYYPSNTDIKTTIEKLVNLSEEQFADIFQHYDGTFQFGEIIEPMIYVVTPDHGVLTREEFEKQIYWANKKREILYRCLVCNHEFKEDKTYIEHASEPVVRECSSCRNISVTSQESF